MDPAATLELIRDLAQKVIESESGDAGDLAEAIQNLDNWISNGGFLPEAWSEIPDRA